MPVNVNLAHGVDLVLAETGVARLLEQLNQAVATSAPGPLGVVLDDDHPLWDRHSGGSGHEGPEWGTDDDNDAEAFYARLGGKAKVFFDLLLDQPGRQLTVDELIALSNGVFTSSFSIAGAINGLRLAYEASGRRYPFYWWEGNPTRYAVKPSVADLFNAARAKMGD